MRDRLLAQVWSRLEQFGADQDATTILSPTAVSEVQALLEAVPDPAADVEVALAAGWLYCVRYLAVEEGEDQEDLDAALTWFAPVHEVRPDAIPDQVRTSFDEGLPKPPAGRSEAIALLVCPGAEH